MEKQIILNRQGQKMVVLVEKPPKSKGLAFIMHGLGGAKEHPHIAVMAQVFFEAGYTVVRFDTTDSFGESEGNYEDATTTNYYQDLEDIIAWAKTQSWYQEPFILAGHSLGGLCIALYALSHPGMVKACAPLGTVVSGMLSTQSPQYAHGKIEEWKKTGWRIGMSESKPGLVKKLKWSHMEDRLKYDLIPQASKLTMPVLLITGESDESCPPAHQQLFYDALPPGKKELHIVSGAPHSFRERAHLEQLQKILKTWLEKF